MKVDTNVTEPIEMKAVPVSPEPLFVEDAEPSLPTPTVYSLPEKITERILQVNKSLQQVHQQHMAKLDEILQIHLDSAGIELTEKDKINFNPDFKSFIINHE